MDMIERVARAICVADGNPNPEMETEPNGDPAWTHYADFSRVAIAAMRRPTEAMELAGDEHSASGATVWLAMIDAALEEK